MKLELTPTTQKYLGLKKIIVFFLLFSLSLRTQNVFNGFIIIDWNNIFVFLHTFVTFMFLRSGQGKSIIGAQKLARS